MACPMKALQSAPMLALLAALAAGEVIAAEPAKPASQSNPDWPCIQHKVPTLTSAQMWDGPPVDAAQISEPDPGRQLIETARGVVTTFTIVASADGTRVRFDTILEEPGLQGFVTRLFAPRLLAPIYEDELDRLEALARAHAPHTVGYPRVA